MLPVRLYRETPRLANNPCGVSAVAGDSRATAAGARRGELSRVTGPKASKGRPDKISHRSLGRSRALRVCRAAARESERSPHYIPTSFISV
ncbi:hypothetical protein EVAR_80919_1 [Eumeta japonica]|uniref:Uncharacterized protein n=1 Tax=Eumeta variegata TaxID=151549 RepID=A0A4C1V1J7_EUMVA|nr:hypothetical protein EVAR_80919_1 [Eumeta japonica]